MREWQQEKPDKACIFFTRNMVSRNNQGEQDFVYNAYQITEILDSDGSRLAWCDLEGYEFGDYDSMYYEHYYIVDLI